jgi:hypothetical protein
MVKNMSALPLVAFAIVSLFVPAHATAQGWTVNLGAGASPTVGDIGSRLNSGWNMDVRAGRELTNGVGVFGDFTFSGLGVSDQVLQSLQVPNGTARVYSLTAGPMWKFPIGTRVNGHLLGGIGWARRTVEFTQPTLGVITVIDPWWGYVGPVLVPANQVLGSISDNAFATTVGGGLSVPLGDSGAAAFAEVRYQHANTSPTSTSLVPVTFGVRFSSGGASRP